MRTLFGYAGAMVMTAALGAGCSGSEVIGSESQRMHHEIQVLEWRVEQMQQRNADLKRQIDAYNRAVDDRDIAFYATRIPGNRSAAFQE